MRSLFRTELRHSSPGRTTRHAGHRPRAPRWLLAAALALGGFDAALAAPCAGFDDVDTTSDFCTNVEWVRNRGITLGCTATQYCPDNAVTRLQMAAFLNRLGTALQPVYLHASQLVSAFPALGETVICQVTNQAANTPRLATPASSTIRISSPGAVTAFAFLVVSGDNGLTWTGWGTRASVFPANAAGVSSSQSPAAPPLVVNPGQTLKFGIQPLKSSMGPDIDEADCELTVRLENAG